MSCRISGLLLALLLAVCGAPSPAAAAESTAPEMEVWLVTYGPGEIYWQRFGHNAIWIRDASLGLDHTFNFGFFDFAQENFFLRFLQGRMLYFSAARPASEEFAEYIDENRTIRAQRLALNSGQAMRLASYLLEEVRPENREYLYDYYRNNCATRVRDALDLALSGRLSERFGQQVAEQSWRDHTRRLTAPDFWLYLGLEIVLGAPVDTPIDRWQEMFIPAMLAESLLEIGQSGPEGAAGDAPPLVAEDVILYRSTGTEPPAAAQTWWPRYLLASLAVLGAAWLLTRRAPASAAGALARLWFGISGIAGCAMLFFWFGTDHEVAAFNLNLLVFSPLWLWPAWSSTAAGRTVPLVAGLSLLALAMPFLPPWQYSLDVLAAFLPLNLAAALAVDATGRRHGYRTSAGN